MKKILLLLISLIFVWSCSDSPTSNLVKPTTDINNLVNSSGELAAQEQAYSKVQISTKSETAEESGVNYLSQSKVMRLTNKFDEIVAFNSAYADVLYPGSLLQGKDILDGKLSSLGNFAREPITLTMQGGNSKTIANPTLATVTNGISELIASSNPTPAQMQYTKTELYDSDQAFLELGLNVNWLSGQLSGKFQKENSVKKKSIFLYFKQVYYTVSMNSLTTPADFFAKDVNLDQLKEKITTGNPPCYISSISYGRIIIVKMTSEESYDKMKAAIEGSYAVVSGKAGFDKSKFKINSSFDAVIVGGSAQGAADAATSGSIDKINELIQREATFSADNPGFPISYTIRYLNGSPLKLGKATEYTAQDWQVDESQYQKFDIYFSHFEITDDGNTFSDGKFYYKLWITDKNGNVLRDGNGDEAKIEKDRYSYIQAGSGERVELNVSLKGIIVKKGTGEQIQVSAELKDYFSSGNDKVAGTGGMVYTYPWSTIPTQWYNLTLSGSGYETYLTYRMVKL